MHQSSLRNSQRRQIAREDQPVSLPPSHWPLEREQATRVVLLDGNAQAGRVRNESKAPVFAVFESDGARTKRETCSSRGMLGSV